MIELEESLNVGGDEEMDVSDNDDDVSRKRARKDNEQVNKLKAENDSLRCQLEAYKNEVDLVRIDLKSDLEYKEKQLKIAHQTLNGMQQQLLESKRKQNDDEFKLLELQARLKAAITAKVEAKKSEGETKEAGGEDGAASADPEVQDAEVDPSESILMLTSRLTEKEAKLIGLISMFLHVHPFGAGVDYIWSYVQKMEPNLKTAEVETLLNKFPSLFQQELSGIGANMERRWLFAGFKTSLV